MITQQIEAIVENKIRPKSRYDGGDIRFESFADGIITLGAHQNCSICICCDERFAAWITKEVKKELGITIKEVKFNRHVPYYRNK